MTTEETQRNLLMPHSIEAEMSVLGSMLLGEDGVERAIEILSHVDFYREGNGMLFDVMTELHLLGMAVDPVTVKERLIARELLEMVGGMGFLIQLEQISYTTANVSYYAAIVRDHAIRRRAIAAAAEIYRQAFDTTLSPSTLMAWAQGTIADCERAQGSGGWTDISDMANDFAADLKDRMENRQELTGISSGIRAIDRATLGLGKGELIILAGRPAMGKSSLAASVALSVARQGGRVGFLSAEMGKPSLMKRFVASESGIPLRNIQTGQLNEDQFQAVKRTLRTIRETFAMKVDDAPGISVTLAETRCRRLRRDLGGVDLIVVDYLQYLAPSEGEKFGTPREKVTDVTKRLKNIARSLDVPVIALAQLNRDVEKREDKRPMKSDLAESGAIEAEADIIWFLYRASQYGKQMDRSGKETVRERGVPPTPDRAIGGIPCDLTQLIIAKNRNGPEGYVPIGFIEETTRFDDLEEGIF